MGMNTRSVNMESKAMDLLLQAAHRNRRERFVAVGVAVAFILLSAVWLDMWYPCAVTPTAALWVIFF